MDSPEVVEGDAGVSFMEFELKRDAASVQSTTVSWRTVEGGTATAGEDYGAVMGAATFTSGETVKTVRVPVFGDKLKEGTETVRIEVSPVPGLRIPATGRILDDDELPVGVRDTYVHERPGALATARVDPVHARLMLFNDVSHYADQPLRPSKHLSRWWDSGSSQEI